MYDVLIGLFNWLYLLDWLEDVIVQVCQFDGLVFVVLFLDLDCFKLVNDSIGYVVGDQMLVEVVKWIVLMVFSEDVVVWLGGDEFVILLQCCYGLFLVVEFVQWMLMVLEELMWVKGCELFFFGSFGIVMWYLCYCNGEELVCDVDVVMYCVKVQGKDCCVVFDEVMCEEVLCSLDLEVDLCWVIINCDFFFYYQLIVCLFDGEVVGYEVLLCWQYEWCGLLLLSVFFDLGEESGLIEQVDWLFYEQVIGQLVCGGCGYLLVNVLLCYFWLVDFSLCLFGLIEVVGVDLYWLWLEIIEVVLFDDGLCMLCILQMLCEWGVLVQLDDFGIGFLVLFYLYWFLIFMFKIDQSFIVGLYGQDIQSIYVLVQGVLLLVCMLGIEMVGEGIENVVQCDMLL